MLRRRREKQFGVGHVRGQICAEDRRRACICRQSTSGLLYDPVIDQVRLVSGGPHIELRLPDTIVPGILSARLLVAENPRGIASLQTRGNGDEGESVADWMNCSR